MSKYLRLLLKIGALTSRNDKFSVSKALRASRHNSRLRVSRHSISIESNFMCYTFNRYFVESFYISRLFFIGIYLSKTTIKIEME